MSAIRWLVVQEVCRRFEFACHFESHLARPPPFYMRMRTTISDEHSIVVLYSQPIRLTWNIKLLIKPRYTETQSLAREANAISSARAASDVAR